MPKFHHLERSQRPAGQGRPELEHGRRGKVRVGPRSTADEYLSGGPAGCLRYVARCNVEAPGAKRARLARRRRSSKNITTWTAIRDRR
jgi:hypothetical protein